MQLTVLLRVTLLLAAVLFFSRHYIVGLVHRPAGGSGAAARAGTTRLAGAGGTPLKAAVAGVGGTSPSPSAHALVAVPLPPLRDTLMTEFKVDVSSGKFPSLADASHSDKGVYGGKRWQLWHKAEPRVVVFHDVLSVEQCAELIRVGESRMARSSVVNGGGSAVNDIRTSDGMFFTGAIEETPANVALRALAAKFTGVPAENVEATQLLRYQPGQRYLAHPDYFMQGSPHLARGGQRFSTVFFWLNDVTAGGETSFPSADVRVAPARGRAMVFYSYDYDGRIDHTSMHEAHPPGKGNTKFVAVCWVREHKFV
jgi:prolyl 4-hydroxylase